MIIVMESSATDDQVKHVIEWVEARDYRTHLSSGDERTIIGVIGNDRPLDKRQVARLDGVEKTMPVLAPYKLASLDMHPDPTTIALNGSQVGEDKVLVIAGPCSVESRDQILETAQAVKEAGATALRGGAYKPRTSPYSFQGLGEEGLELLAEAREATGLPVVTEVMDPELVTLVTSYADVLQIGARNMQNFALLKAVGATDSPVLLKRGASNTMEELLMAAEYILSCGNANVMLCERGIRTFEPYTRNTFDVNAIPALKQRTHLPIIADPSHSTGHWQLVEPAALAAVAAGADGLIVEVHPNPEEALSDGLQSLKPERFVDLMTRIKAIADAVGRSA